MELNPELLKQLEHYLTGMMTEDEISAFEKEVRSNKHLQEFLLLYKDLDTIDEESDWISRHFNSDLIQLNAKKFRDQETVEFTKKVHNFHQAYTSTPNKSKFRGLIYASMVAAACLLLLFQLWPSSITLEEVYTKHSSWNELASFSEKSDATETQSITMERAFQQENFKEVIDLASQIVQNSETPVPNVLIYKGIAEMELNRFEAALQSFTILANSDVIDAHKAYWYIALVYAKKNDEQAFITALKKVVSSSSNYRYEEAVLLLKEFE